MCRAVTDVTWKMDSSLKKGTRKALHLNIMTTLHVQYGRRLKLPPCVLKKKMRLTLLKYFN